MGQKNNRTCRTQGDPAQEDTGSPYHDFLNGVRRLSPPDRDSVPEPAPTPKHTLTLPQAPSCTHLLDLEPHEDSQVHGDSVLAHRPPSLPHTVWRRFKRTMPAEAVCDLHGLTVAEAAVRSEQFLVQAHEAGLRVVRLITGRGGSTSRLKKAMAQWLPQWPMVLGWHSAKPQDGGLGAVDVLLRARRD